MLLLAWLLCSNDNVDDNENFCSQLTDSTHYTLNATQENFHADFADFTEDSCLAGNINLTQNTQNSQKASRRALAGLHRGFFLSHADVADFTEGCIARNAHSS